jgi:hypothetical protein
MPHHQNAHRVRQKITPRVTKPSTLYQVSDYGCVSENKVTGLTYDFKSEVMTDTTGFLQNDFNPVHHEKLQALIRPVITWVEGDPLTQVTNSCAGGLVPKEIAPVIRDTLSPDPQWLDDFAALAEHHFKTAVDDTHSILNFLIEAIEMCEGNVEKLKALSDKILKALKLFRELYKKTGKFWLSWNFAIKPTIGDVYNIIDSLTAAKKRLKWLRDHNHLDTKVKYRFTPLILEGVAVVDYQLPDYDYTVPPPYHTCASFPDANKRFELEYQATILPCAHAWVRFDIPDMYLDEDFGLGIVWASLAGLYNPLKVAWEAVPYSWLIDWFVNMKTRLQLEAANLSPLKDAEILSTGHSLKTKVTGLIYYCSDSPLVKEEVGGFTYECYVRRPGLPYQEVFPFRIPIEWYNASILASLISQKRRR